MPFLENELHPSLLAQAGANPWPGHDSSSRVQMYMSHMGQALQVVGAEQRRIFTGIEKELGKCTFSIKMPCRAEIIQVIDKYPISGVGSTFRENSLSTVIYEDVETKEVGFLNLVNHHSMHQHFGFRYKHTDQAQRLVPGSTVNAGTILADSPSVDENGQYCYGVETNVALMSVPGVIEDGIIVSEDYVRKLKTRGVEKRVASWGNRYYPLNLYGDEENYKPFPEIGDRVRPDGLVFALREYDEDLAIIEMTPKALMEVDHIHDVKIYIADPNARVVDIDVAHDHTKTNPPTPQGMTAQTTRYREAKSNYYRKVWNVYTKLKAQRGDSLKITPQFNHLLVQAQADTHMSHNNRVSHMYRKNKIDDWRVEITLEYEFIPKVGAKLTGCHADKGVICEIWPTERMPIDERGNRADMIMDGDSTIKRMNIGRMYEHYIGATIRDLSSDIRATFGLPVTYAPTELQMREAVKGKPELIESVYGDLLRLYKIISPKMYEAMINGSVNAQQHISSVLRHGIYVWLPTDNPAESVTIVEELQAQFPVHIGHVTYVGQTGLVRRTKLPVLIGTLYIMMLEKTGGDWSAVSSSKLQHFGMPAKLTNSDRYGSYGRPQPVRILDESTTRLFAAAAGGDTVADIFNQSNNPRHHREIYANILRAERPTDIDAVIDREKHPVGFGRNLVFINHQLECAGIQFEYEEPLK